MFPYWCFHPGIQKATRGVHSGGHFAFHRFPLWLAFNSVFKMSSFHIILINFILIKIGIQQAWTKNAPNPLILFQTFFTFFFWTRCFPDLSLWWKETQYPLCFPEQSCRNKEWQRKSKNHLNWEVIITAKWERVRTHADGRSSCIWTFFSSFFLTV